MKGYRVLAIIVALALLPTGSDATDADRSRLPLREALQGHWYSEALDKHEFYRLTDGDGVWPVYMTWHAEGGRDVSAFPIGYSIHDTDETNNVLVLVQTFSPESKSYTRYEFNERRTVLTWQPLDEEFQPDDFFPGTTLRYVDGATRSPFVERP